MNLIEAHASGRRYDRVSEGSTPSWFRYEDKSDQLNIECALATDWQLEPIPEKTVTISRSQFVGICRELLKKDEYEPALQWFAYFLPELEMRLGLRDFE